MTDLIDTHIHLNFLASPHAQLAEARQAGVGAWVVPGTTPRRWPELMAMVAANPGAWGAPGVHPMAAAEWRPEEHAPVLRRLADDPRLVAIGEVGLDRKAAVSPTLQEELFVAMIRLARELDRPLLLHARGGTDRLLELLRREEAQRIGGICHAFNGSLDTARALAELGFVLGIGGVVTFAGARRLPELVQQVPAEWLVLETDAPDLPPEPYRGSDNRAAWLPLVAARVAALRGWSLAETARITTDNACRALRRPLTRRPEPKSGNA